MESANSLAERPTTVKNVSEFVRLISDNWNSDPEKAHRLEFYMRSNVLNDIASGKLNGKAAMGVCSHLVKLTNNVKLQRWFA